MIPLLTGLLFYVVAYLTIGGLVTGFLRFVGLPNLTHGSVDGHYSACYALDKQGYRTSEIKCPRYYSRLGGQPFQLILWIMWTLFWPFPVAFALAFAVIFFFVKLLWVKY